MKVGDMVRIDDGWNKISYGIIVKGIYYTGEKEGCSWIDVYRFKKGSIAAYSVLELEVISESK
tara:strand:+ start:505 stop:693 length:189 start_codon:yes stop_codon:yes gene_type:complete